MRRRIKNDFDFDFVSDEDDDDDEEEGEQSADDTGNPYYYLVKSNVQTAKLSLQQLKSLLNRKSISTHTVKSIVILEIKMKMKMEI